MIIRDPHARIVRVKKRSLFMDRWLYSFECGEFHTNAQWDELTYRRILDSQRQIPVQMGSIGTLTWWMYGDKFYHTDEVHTPDQIKAAILSMELEHPQQSAPMTPEALQASTSIRSLGESSTAAEGDRQIDEQLPSLALLDGPVQPAVNQDLIRKRVRTLEETLSDFGVPAKVVEVNQGPIITQFVVEPGSTAQGSTDHIIRAISATNRIAALRHDLELAFAAAPVQIEHLAGHNEASIEVPNPKIGVVDLRSVIESEAFRNIKSKLGIALGQNMIGQPVCADVARMPHLLIGGATGSGKSTCIHAIIATLLCNATPADVRFVMIDTKRIEFIGYNGIPHLIRPVALDVDDGVLALHGIVSEMDRRFSRLAEMAVRNIEIYNHIVGDQPDKRLPFLVIVVDELAGLMTVASEVERSLVLLAQRGRAVGIHLILATQRPSVDIVTGSMKAQLPARICFAVTSGADSRVVLDTPGAEKLLGRGDMLYVASDSSKPMRLQGCYVSDAESARLANHWRDWAITYARGAANRLPWADTDAAPHGGDELLARATELVRRSGTASISYLQRKLRIGYPQAARLMDQLEAAGVVGPDAGGGKPRIVLPAAWGRTPGYSKMEK